MNDYKLFRKRFIPDEIVELKDDIIISLDKEKNILLTKWKVLKPRSDIDTGISAYFMDEGFKISKEYNKENELVYWYCDIIDTDYDENTKSYIFTDLLADVLIYPDNSVKVVDLDEIGTALETGLCDSCLMSKSLKITSKLLDIIYSGNFDSLSHYINDYEKQVTN